MDKHGEAKRSMFPLGNRFVMNKFLRCTRDGLKQYSKFSRIHVILGNEACDLDSTVSSIVYGYYLDKTKVEPSTLHLPMLNITRAEFNLRTEVVWFLKKHQLTGDLLTFRDDVDLHALKTKVPFSITLVDHNVQKRSDVELESYVTEIIDHHQQDRTLDVGQTTLDATIVRVGSCCTLLHEKIAQNPKFDLSQEVASLLAGPIVLDTAGLSPDFGSTTLRDQVALQQIQQIQSVNILELLNGLSQAKADIKNLTTLEVLHKDMKMVLCPKLRIAVAAVPVHIQEFLSRPDVQCDFSRFLSEESCDVLVVMSLSVGTGDNFTRQLSVYTKQHQYRDMVIGWLREARDPSLELVPLDDLTSDDILTFTQGNVKASRKVILPLINTKARELSV